MTPRLALLILPVSAAAAVWSFAAIVRWYKIPSGRTLSGLPWIPSLLFAVAALGAIFALHALNDL
jgi:hypothetical protein